MSERGPKKRRMRIATAAGPLAVPVPEDASVADACAAVEARLRGSGQLGNRRIRTFLLPDGCELGAADSLGDVVQDGEELQPVFEAGDVEVVLREKRVKLEHGSGAAHGGGWRRGGARG